MNTFQSSTRIKNNENDPNSSIKSEPNLKDSGLLDEKYLLMEKMSLLPSDKNEIITTIQNSLLKINFQKVTIENISAYICDKIYKFRKLIILDIFQLIFDINHYRPKIEYLCLLNEIITHNFGIDKTENDFIVILTLIKKKVFPYIKAICSDLNYQLSKFNKENVNYFVNEWKKNKYFSNDLIKEIKFELKIRDSPDITGTKHEINCLQNMVNYGEIKIDQALIDYSRQLETLDRNKDNKQRKNMLKIEKELIQKQMKLYQTHIQQLKDINMLINKIDECQKEINGYNN